MKLLIEIPYEAYYTFRCNLGKGNLNALAEIVANGIPYEEVPQGEWIDYNNTFYKCPDCGYLLEKCCPQCQNKVILPKGGAENG